MPITAPINDWGDAIMLSVTNALNSFLAAIPSIIGALVILAIGWFLSGILARLVTAALSRAGADRVFAQHGNGVYPEQAMQYPPSRIAGEVVRWLVRIVFLIAAANVLNLPQVSTLLNQILLWIPNLIVAAIILLLAPVLARFVRGAIEVGAGQMGFTNAPLLGRIAQYAIIAFAVVIAINQVGIAANLVNTLFVGLVAAIALAVGLAFGLGGRDVAAEMTRSWYASSRATADRVRERAAQQGASAQAARPQAAPTAMAPRREARTTSAATFRANDTSVDR
ncbi:MAG TPA: mechanosensitive ion channel [Candidatus Limnocylindrales bacterium]|nr:mechanosensitive ion channel [Candidatus Limnocylindrales bacterium]